MGFSSVSRRSIRAVDGSSGQGRAPQVMGASTAHLWSRASALGAVPASSPLPCTEHQCPPAPGRPLGAGCAQHPLGSPDSPAPPQPKSTWGQRPPSPGTLPAHPPWGGGDGHCGAEAVEDQPCASLGPRLPTAHGSGGARALLAAPHASHLDTLILRLKCMLKICLHLH